MAASHVTGAAQDGYDLRRRNVPSPTKSNGSVTSPQTEIDKKKSQKVDTGVSISLDNADDYFLHSPSHPFYRRLTNMNF